MDVEFCSDQFRHLIGFNMRDRLGTDVIAINTWQERVDMPEVQRGDRMRYVFTLPIDLKPGYYSLSPAVAYHQDIQQWMDRIRTLSSFASSTMTAPHRVRYLPAVSSRRHSVGASWCAGRISGDADR